jgi:hypothetical protein
MMLGLAIGNSVAAIITSRYRINLWNAVAGAAFEVLVSGLMTRWTAHTSRAEAVILLVVLGIGQVAVMSGLLKNFLHQLQQLWQMRPSHPSTANGGVGRLVPIREPSHNASSSRRPLSSMTSGDANESDGMLPTTAGNV